jgi:hypothetical protein
MDQENTYRELQTSTNFTYFQFKMYWEPGYCWQAEKNERKWCMECQGSDCNENDYLWLQTCDENDSEERQQFLYEPLSAFGGGRIKPYHDQSLCWERTRINAYQLMPCSPLDDINTTQIVAGFQENTRFEMYPYGMDPNSTTDVKGPKCLDNHHHPKAEEIVKAEYCSSSRQSRTSYWIVYNPVTLSSSGGEGGGSQGGGNGAPEVTAISGDYCTPSAPCAQCYGDCDDDEDCEGDLVCFQRDAGDAVPSCSGGEASDSDSDFCIDPNWESGQGSSPPPTAAPSPSPVAEEPTGEPTSQPIGDTTSSPTDSGTTDSSPTVTPATAEPTASSTTAAPSPAVPTSAGLPEVVAVSGSFCTPTAPCTVCYGDCDEDSDCEGELICGQRDAGELVPGCSGGENSQSDTDYCVDPNANTGGRSPVTSAPQTAATPSPTASPVGGGSYPVLSYTDSCSPTAPCPQCAGDCDVDSDCIGSLICPNRNGGEPVPGCSGSDNSRTDFCVEP